MQIQFGASSKQVIATIQNDITMKNSFFKQKYVYNERVAQRQKQLSLLTLIQVIMIELNKQADWYTHYVKDDEDCIEQLFFGKASS